MLWDPAAQRTYGPTAAQIVRSSALGLEKRCRTRNPHARYTTGCRRRQACRPMLQPPITSFLVAR